MAEGMVTRYNIESYINESEPECGYLREEVIPLGNWKLVNGDNVGATSTGVSYQGNDQATSAGDLGWAGATAMPVIAWKESAETEIVRCPQVIPFDMVMGAEDKRFEPYIAIGLRWRFVSAALASTTTALKVTARWQNQGVNNTFNNTTVTAAAAGTGVAYATVSGFQWTWFEVCGAADTTVGMTAAQKRTLVAGALIDYQIGISAVLGSDECFQISGTAIRMRRHLTIKDKTARAYRHN